MWQELGFSYKSDFKVGDVVNCVWKDINGVGDNKYYQANVVEIKDNGNVSVRWLGEDCNSTLQQEKILKKKKLSSLNEEFQRLYSQIGKLYAEELTRDYNENREFGNAQDLLKVKLGEIGVPA